MSTPTNYNQPNTPDYGTSPDGSNQKRMTTIMGVAIAVLLGLCVYLLVSKYRTSSRLEATSMELTEQKEAFTELDLKYNEAVTQLEQQKGINAELMQRSTSNLLILKTRKTKSLVLSEIKKTTKVQSLVWSVRKTNIWPKLKI